MRFYKVEMGGFEPWLWTDHGQLAGPQKSWTQPPGHWTLFFFEHNGTLSINNRPIPFVDGNVGFVVPGTKASFDRTGEGTRCYTCTFGLVTRTETMAIPAVADLGDLTEVRRKEMENAYAWITTSIMRTLACSFNILWSIAQPISVFRKSDLVYDAESLLMKRLGEKINVADLAHELGISHSHLLRLFREEHNCTIQEYIRNSRAEIARQLITESSLSIKQIAIKVGLPDLQHFNKIVRSATGLSPTALREQALTRTRH